MTVNGNVIFEGDLKLLMGNDGGEISVDDGLFVCDRNFDTAILLSLFGGNIEDDGTVWNTSGWWGNYTGGNEDRKMQSRFQSCVQGMTLTVSTAKEAIKAAKTDLQWLIDTGCVDELEVSGSIEDVKRFGLTVKCIKDRELIDQCEYMVNLEEAQNGL